ncbi:Rv3654c family TadE-like protein [Corynebacterium auriscanis]|uniref:Rv3654c family TadE-like protein n=1 Tax=Corynebacterium auriscanis TaxID=99807 RepID=UPI003CF8DCCB
MSTTYGATVILAVLSVVMYVAVGTTDLMARQKATVAADLAALSAATDLLSGGDDPCAVANTIAGLNHASVRECQIEAEFVRVTVTVNQRRSGSASALAGPVG